MGGINMIVRISHRNLTRFLKDQLDYFNIDYRGGWNITPTWVCVGYDSDPQSIISRQNGIEVHNHWIKLIGFSRIDGYPMFQIDEHKWGIGIQDLISHVGLTLLNNDGSINFMRDDFVVERVRELNDVAPWISNIIEPKGKQIFSLVDPYGEEIWEE